MNLRSRQEVEIEPRRQLTRREVIELCVRQDGRCGCGCGVKLDALKEGCVDEHVVRLNWSGPNDLQNRAMYRKPCAAAKTKREATQDAKCDRIIKREVEGPPPSQFRPGRKLESRGFDKGLRKKFDGSVERRT